MAGNDKHPEQDASDSSKRRAALQRARRALEARICKNLTDAETGRPPDNREYGLENQAHQPHKTNEENGETPGQY